MTRPVERFSPATFFLGGASGRGAVRARDGRVTEAYTVQTDGKLLTSRRALVVTETYTFEGGRTDRVHWDLPHADDTLGLTASEDRVAKPIRTAYDGAELTLHFTRTVPGGRREPISLDFNVRFSPLQSGTVLSFATIRRFGLVVGSMVTFYERHV